MALRWCCGNNNDILSFQSSAIILILTAADFPFTIAIVGSATLFGHLVDNATDTRTGDLLPLVLSFLNLFGLKPFHIEAIVFHIDNGAVDEVNAIVLVIDTSEVIAILMEFVHESVIRSGVEDVA